MRAPRSRDSTDTESAFTQDGNAHLWSSLKSRAAAPQPEGKVVVTRLQPEGPRLAVRGSSPSARAWPPSAHTPLRAQRAPLPQQPRPSFGCKKAPGRGTGLSEDKGDQRPRPEALTRRPRSGRVTRRAPPAPHSRPKALLSCR